MEPAIERRAAVQGIRSAATSFFQAIVSQIACESLKGCFQTYSMQPTRTVHWQTGSLSMALQNGTGRHSSTRMPMADGILTKLPNPRDLRLPFQLPQRNPFLDRQPKIPWLHNASTHQKHQRLFSSPHPNTRRTGQTLIRNDHRAVVAQSAALSVIAGSITFRWNCQ